MKQLYSGRFIGRPWMPWSAYPWRAMDNRERLARWALAYRAQVPTEPRPWIVTESMKIIARQKMRERKWTS